MCSPSYQNQYASPITPRIQTAHVPQKNSSNPDCLGFCSMVSKSSPMEDVICSSADSTNPMYFFGVNLVLSGLLYRPDAHLAHDLDARYPIPALYRVCAVALFCRLGVLQATYSSRAMPCSSAWLISAIRAMPLISRSPSPYSLGWQYGLCHVVLPQDQFVRFGIIELEHDTPLLALVRRRDQHEWPRFRERHGMPESYLI